MYDTIHLPQSRCFEFREYIGHILQQMLNLHLMKFFRVSANDIIAVIGGLAVYVIMVVWAHQWLFGVAPV